MGRVFYKYKLILKYADSLCYYKNENYWIVIIDVGEYVETYMSVCGMECIEFWWLYSGCAVNILLSWEGHPQHMLLFLHESEELW